MHLYNLVQSVLSKALHTESLLHQGVVSEGDALLPHPAMATFVDELTHRLQVGVPGGATGCNG